MNCPFKMSGRDGDICEDCGARFAGDMTCGLAKVTPFMGAPISAGAAAVCDPSTGICEGCE